MIRKDVLKKQWENSKVLVDTEILVKDMAVDQRRELLKSLKIVNDYCGLSMKDEYLITVLELSFKYPKQFPDVD